MFSQQNEIKVLSPYSLFKSLNLTFCDVFEPFCTGNILEFIFMAKLDDILRFLKLLVNEKET